MLKSQKSLCAICNKKIRYGRGNSGIDHNHKTKKIRGILCNKCNIALSYIENSKWLKEALKYINK